MSFSLYEAFIPSCIQMLNAGQGLIEKAKASDLDEDTIVNARLADDMQPFAYQVKSMVVHSVGAIESVRKGAFSPDMTKPAQTLEQMRLNLGAAENTLRAISKGEIDSFIGGETRFVFPQKNYEAAYASEDFLLSFSQPHFYFHTTTTYAILRNLGLPIGKGDFMGPTRKKAG